MHRRAFLGALAILPVGWYGRRVVADEAPQAASGATAFDVTRTDAQWRRILTSAQYQILRKANTERPGSSPLNDEHRAGAFLCAGCALPLFRSQAKFDSGTGWPSFTAPLPDAVGTSVARSLFGERTEVHCRRCGGHLGHVFDDGPAPTGKRYCMNGAAMTFAQQGALS